jgi:hypothetical protein
MAKIPCAGKNCMELTLTFLSSQLDSSYTLVSLLESLNVWQTGDRRAFSSSLSAFSLNEAQQKGIFLITTIQRHTSVYHMHTVKGSKERLSSRNDEERVAHSESRRKISISKLVLPSARQCCPLTRKNERNENQTRPSIFHHSDCKCSQCAALDNCKASIGGHF